MSAPLVWIIIPAGASGLLFLLRRWQRMTLGLGTFITLALAGAARLLPVDEVVNLGPWSFKIDPTLTVLGRRFILQNADLPMLAIIYLVAALWLATAMFASPGRLFGPLAFGVITLLTAALAVDPFLYAALFIETAALLAVPLLVGAGEDPGRGVLRFLTFQTLGIPFVLFTGWLLAGVEASPGDLETVLRASLLLGFGFAFLLGVFPFHTWIPLLMQGASPFAGGFALLVFPGFTLLFGLTFFERYAWLRNATTPYTLLGLAGLLMALAGGAWAIFQRHLGRVLGFAMVTEVGLALLAISARGEEGLRLFWGLFLTRAIAVLVWSLALARFQLHFGSLEFEALRGAGRRLPLTAVGLLVAHLSMAGLPLLAGFPVRLQLWAELAARNPLLAVGAFFASAGLLVAAVRSLWVLADEPDEAPAEAPPAAFNLGLDPSQGYFLVGTLVLVLLGLFPQWFSPFIGELVRAVGTLLPGH